MINIIEKNKTKLDKDLNNSNINSISILKILKTSLYFLERKN